MSRLKKIFARAKMELERLIYGKRRLKERISRFVSRVPAQEGVRGMPPAFGFGDHGRARFLAHEIEDELKSHELTAERRRELKVALNLLRFLCEKGAPVPESVDEMVRLSRGLEECFSIDIGRDMGELILSDRMLAHAARNEKEGQKN